MRLAAYAILLCAGTISAQKVAEPEKIADLVKLLEPQPIEQPLQCKAKIVKPTLDFAFRFEAGYSFQMPLNQYSGPDHSWTVLTEVTPQEVNGSPVYFLDTGVLGELVLQMGSNVGAAGGYRLGEGRYNVRWLLLDDLGRICRKRWRIEVGRKGKFVAMAPHTVSGLSSSEASAQAYTGPGTPMRITVLLDAAPLQVQPESPSGLRGRERAMLFDGLLGLMERLPTSSVRLIVFNLEQQQEVLRREDFTVTELDDVARALKDLELGSVQLGVLEKPKGHIDLITSLLNAEIRSPSPSDAVVLLGPQERYFDKVPDGALDTPRGNKPRFFSVQFVPPPRWVNAIVPVETANGYKGGGITPITIDNFDTITKVVKKLNGKAVQVLTPDQFENAIKDIELSR
jgi:hypothetical protein